MHEEVINLLFNLYESQGYLLEDTVLDILDKKNISTPDMCLITEALALKGVLLVEKVENSPIKQQDLSDKSRVNYEQIYSEILTIDKTLKKIINKVRDIAPPQRNEWKQLLGRAKGGNNYAREKLILLYLRIAVREGLYHHLRYEIPLDEAIQMCCIGSILGYENFSLEHEESYSQYIRLWVRQAIRRDTQPRNQLIKIPVHIKEKFYIFFDTINTYTDSLYKPYNQNLLAKEICENYDLSIVETQKLLGFYYTFLSFDEMILFDKYRHKEKIIAEYPYTDLNFHPIFDSPEEIPSSENIFPDELDNIQYILSDNGAYEEIMLDTVSNIMLNIKLEDVFRRLKPTELLVIKLRFGFDDESDKTLEEIGQMLNVTRERIRQIESKALLKIKNGLRIDYNIS